MQEEKDVDIDVSVHQGGRHRAQKADNFISFGRGRKRTRPCEPTRSGPKGKKLSCPHVLPHLGNDLTDFAVFVLVLDEISRMDVCPEEDECIAWTGDMAFWLGLRMGLLLGRAVNARLGRRDVLAHGRG